MFTTYFGTTVFKSLAVDGRCMTDATALVDGLLQVEPHQYIVIEGYPESDSETRWHVNKAIRLGVGGDGTRAIVLQDAAAAERWLVAILNQTDTGWSFDKFAAFEGEPPAGLEAEDAGTELNPEDITIIHIETDS